MKFGVIRFPGTCDDVDAQLAAARVGDATLLWHGDRDLQGVEAVIVPGGFSYGDYLRTGAIARFAPIMEEVIEFAQEGGLVLEFSRPTVPIGTSPGMAQAASGASARARSTQSSGDMLTGCPSGHTK